MSQLLDKLICFFFTKNLLIAETTVGFQLLNRQPPWQDQNWPGKMVLLVC